MLETRVIPCLLLSGSALVKTVKFKKPHYIGDPINAVRIYNGLEVDELFFLDIQTSRTGQGIGHALLRNIADECFMPMTYGGGIKTIDDMKSVYEIGFEKVSLNTEALKNPDLITAASKIFGSQSVVVSIDVKQSMFGAKKIYGLGGKLRLEHSPAQWAKRVESLGAGEILLTSVDRDGTWAGYDIDLIRDVADSVHIPVVASGGAGCIDDFAEAVRGGASAVGAGSMFVFQKKGMGVLINYPSRQQLEGALAPG